jgi:hypothetical protein
MRKIFQSFYLRRGKIRKVRYANFIVGVHDEREFMIVSKLHLRTLQSEKNGGHLAVVPLVCARSRNYVISTCTLLRLNSVMLRMR